jgi:orotate phosphoribosyltransferase
MSESTEGRVALAEALFRTGAIRFGKFTQASGEPSSYHLDMKVLPSEPEAYGLAIGALGVLSKEVGEGNFDVVAGVGTAGVAISSPLAYVLRKPMVYVSNEGGHGVDRKVEGAVLPRRRVLVVDDVVATGGNLVGAVEALRKAGCVVKDALVLVDMLQGGRARLARTGVKLAAFTDVKGLVETLYSEKRITKADYTAFLKELEGRGE